LFLNKFPNAHIFDVVPVVKDGMKQKDTIYYKELANEQIEELRGRLKSKAYDNAMLFYKIEDYNAAMVSFKNALKDYPDMENKDQIEFLIVKSSYYFAKYSIDEKKPERYEAVFTEYKEFVRNNPVTNRYYPEATEINAKAMVELAKHKKLHNIQ
jgi:outer membrane protein assembly factor BamD